ncbi:hypothetical protein SADUNF_Sadunf17G0088700 [Salix dunnii]|uniref:MULE transposase domain-containing protein n=1 Tax=Salix dunnii TaxID=1413687 RepID=A0A835J6M2_9ROSI|nr:hypothetical protein SADUNF_Sadunf17G0088700 [Salix dunnii]
MSRVILTLYASLICLTKVEKKNITWMIDEPAIEAKDLVNSVVPLEDEGDDCCVVEDAERPMVLDVGNIVDTVNVELFQCLNGRVEEPAVGTGFVSKDDAKDFYNAYAGFSIHVKLCYRSKKDNSISIRVNSNYQSKKDNSIISREFCCSIEGLHREKSHKQDYDPNISFSESLSSPAMGLDAPVIVLTEDDKNVGKMIFNFLNCINYVGRERLSNFGIDAQNILGFFKIMQASDPAFYHAIQVDEEGRLSRVFWVDTRSRIVYDCFSDAVAFDTTYQANQYRIPFAPFNGVNHHKESVLFGCALLADETKTSFIWLFTTWLEAMLERQPWLIITDYDSSMINPLILVVAHHKQNAKGNGACIQFASKDIPVELGGDDVGTATYEVAKLDEKQKLKDPYPNISLMSGILSVRWGIVGLAEHVVSMVEPESVKRFCM